MWPVVAGCVCSRLWPGCGRCGRLWPVVARCGKLSTASTESDKGAGILGTWRKVKEPAITKEQSAITEQQSLTAIYVLKGPDIYVLKGLEPLDCLEGHEIFLLTALGPGGPPSCQNSLAGFSPSCPNSLAGFLPSCRNSNLGSPCRVRETQVAFAWQLAVKAEAAPSSYHLPVVCGSVWQPPIYIYIYILAMSILRPLQEISGG